LTAESPENGMISAVNVSYVPALSSP